MIDTGTGDAGHRSLREYDPGSRDHRQWHGRAVPRVWDPEDLDLTLERAEMLVARAQRVFETTVEALEEAVEALKSMPDSGERDVLKDVKAMNIALMQAMDMQEKARVAGSKHFGKGTGSGNGGRLDLAAAREEIAERLARLRDARD
jgi:hypothetical protein